MKCAKCESGAFRRRQALDAKGNPIDGQKIHVCLKCGEEVGSDAPQMMVGVPEHLREQFEEGADEVEKLADLMLASPGAPKNFTPEERQKLIDDLRASDSDVLGDGDEFEKA